MSCSDKDGQCASESFPPLESAAEKRAAIVYKSDQRSYKPVLKSNVYRKEGAARSREADGKLMMANKGARKYIGGLALIKLIIVSRSQRPLYTSSGRRANDFLGSGCTLDKANFKEGD